jgi:hypothetical protein
VYYYEKENVNVKRGKVLSTSSSIEEENWKEESDDNKEELIKDYKQFKLKQNVITHSEMCISSQCNNNGNGIDNYVD